MEMEQASRIQPCGGGERICWPGKEDDDSQDRWKRKAAVTQSAVQDQYQKYCQEDPIDPYEPRADDLGINWKDNDARFG
jgi:hypothetical protein